ncbi:Uncharacterized protein DAT39_011388, partial [Clarias magur]
MNGRCSWWHGGNQRGTEVNRESDHHDAQVAQQFATSAVFESDGSRRSQHAVTLHLIISSLTETQHQTSSIMYARYSGTKDSTVEQSGLTEVQPSSCKSPSTLTVMN